MITNKNRQLILNLIERLKSECNKYVNGKCYTIACMKRGKYYKRGGPCNPDCATCESHEQIIVLESLLKLESKYITKCPKCGSSNLKDESGFIIEGVSCSNCGWSYIDLGIEFGD